MFTLHTAVYTPPNVDAAFTTVRVEGAGGRAVAHALARAHKGPLNAQLEPQLRCGKTNSERVFAFRRLTRSALHVAATSTRLN